MLRTFMLVAALSAIGRVTAQSTSVANFTMPLNIAHTAFSGSIVAVESGLTSVAVQCPSSDTEPLICRSIAHATLVQGPSSVGVSLTAVQAYASDSDPLLSVFIPSRPYSRVEVIEGECDSGNFTKLGAYKAL